MTRETDISGYISSDYLNSMDLHIGVTDSIGAVIEFDKLGLQRQQKAKGWQQCLVLDKLSEEYADVWDQTLDKVIQQQQWSPKK